MLSLKTAQEIAWQDMAKIEESFFARWIIEEYFGPAAWMAEQYEPLWGLPEIVALCVFDPGRRDARALLQVLKALEQGKSFLLKNDPL